MSEWDSPDALAIVQAQRAVPYLGSQENPPMDTYVAPGMTPRVGAPTPDILWLLSNHNELFYVGLMAKWGYTVNSWKAIKDPPPPIKPYIPPRPVPAYIGLESGVGDFMNVKAPEFSA